MPLYGSHLSIAGGYYKAVDRAHSLGFDCVQIFTKNNNQWRAAPMSQADVDRFQQSLANSGVRHPIAHNSYLINLGSPDDVLWRKSIDAMVIELQRAERLGVPHVVSHPGAHVGAGEQAGIARIATAINEILDRTSHLSVSIALETTAGQGSCLGWRFEHLAEIIEKTGRSDRLTACADTCHLFAAGYPLAPKRAFNKTWKEFDSLIGLHRLVAIHVNDSKKDFGSRVDRHEHIGLGKLGPLPFELLVNDRRFRKTPLYLETAKETDPKSGLPWDTVNLSVLKKLDKRATG